MKCLINIFALLLATVFVIFTAARSQPGEWSEPVNVSNTPYSSFYPDIAIGPDGKIHIVWEDNIDRHNIYRMEILYSCLNGIVWSEPVQLSGSDTTYASDPRVAVDSEGYPHVVWTHRAIFPDADIYYTTLTDSGWLEPVNLTSEWSTSKNPDIVIDSQDNLHVVWAKYHYGIYKIFHLINNGIEWLTANIICEDEYSEYFPDLVIDYFDDIHLACVSLNNEIVYFNYTNDSWSEKVNVSNIDSLNSSRPSIAVDMDNSPHIAWHQDLGMDNEEIFFAYKTGMNWSDSYNLTNLSISCGDPQLIITRQETKFLLFSARDEPGDSYIHYMYCMDSTWTYPDTIFSDYTGTHSSMAVDDEENVYACMPIGFIYYCDIGYTYYSFESLVKENQTDKIKDFEFNTYPNPFNTSLTIRLDRISEKNNTLSIYNMLGEIVFYKNNIPTLGGKLKYTWYGKSNTGIPVVSGIYLVRLTHQFGISSSKVVLIK